MDNMKQTTNGNWLAQGSSGTLSGQTRKRDTYLLLFYKKSTLLFILVMK